MKYIKEFESYKDLPKVGDYVVLDVDKIIDIPSLMDIIGNNVGRITIVYPKLNTNSYFYNVKYINTNNKSPFLGVSNEFVEFSLDDFKFWSSDKLEAEAFLNSMKYNL
jgi:hypothetical protein